MWWIINAAGEKCFTVESEDEAKKRLDDWYTSYIYEYVGGEVDLWDI